MSERSDVEEFDKKKAEEKSKEENTSGIEGIDHTSVFFKLMKEEATGMIDSLQKKIHIVSNPDHP